MIDYDNFKLPIDMKTYCPDKLQAVIVKAIQELKKEKDAEIEELKALIATLTN